MTAPGRGKAAASLLVFLLVAIQVIYSPLTSDETIDSYSYHFAARALAEGENPYDTGVLQRLAPDELGFIFPYLYPPVLAVLWRPLTALTASEAHAIFVVVNLALCVLNAFLVWSIVRASGESGARGSGSGRALSVGLAIFVFAHAVMGPLVSSVRLGQINVLLGTLVFAALAFEQRGRSAAAGLCLGAAILIKLTPVVLLVDLLIRRRWRTLVATLVGCGAIVLATLPWCGLDGWREFVDRAIDPLPFNPPMSLKGLLDTIGERVGAAREVRLAAFLILVTILVTSLARLLPRAARARDPVMSWSALVLFALLIQPLTWHHHYYLALLPATAFTLRAFLPVPRRERWVWVALVVAMLLRYPGELHVLKPIAAFVMLVMANGLATPPGSSRVHDS